MLVCGVIRLLDNFVSFGSLVSVATYLLFIVGMLLVLSTCNFITAAVGFGIYVIDYAYSVLNSLVAYHSVNYSGIVYLLLYAYFAYQAYTKATRLGQNISEVKTLFLEQFQSAKQAAGSTGVKLQKTDAAVSGGVSEAASAQNAVAAARVCKNCGAPLEEDAAFCGNCGAKQD